MTRNRADEAGVTEGGHDEAFPVYREKFLDGSMSRRFAELAEQLFLEKKNDYTEYPILKEQDRVTGRRNGPVVSVHGQGFLTPEVNPNVDKLPEDVLEDEESDFYGSIGRVLARPLGMKRKLLKSLDEYRTKKPKVPSNVAEAVESGQEITVGEWLCQYSTVVNSSSHHWREY